MYLALLNDEKKKLFLDLSYCIAKSDGVYCDDEKLMIHSYQQEMRVVYNPERSGTYKTVINTLANTITEQEKKIIVFEALGLALVDGIYDESEREIINYMIEKFDVQKGFADKCENIINEYLSLQSRINSLVLE